MGILERLGVHPKKPGEREETLVNLVARKAAWTRRCMSDEAADRCKGRRSRTTERSGAAWQPSARAAFHRWWDVVLAAVLRGRRGGRDAERAPSRTAEPRARSRAGARVAPTRSRPRRRSPPTRAVPSARRSRAGPRTKRREGVAGRRRWRTCATLSRAAEGCSSSRCTPPAGKAGDPALRARDERRRDDRTMEHEHGAQGRRRFRIARARRRGRLVHRDGDPLSALPIVRGPRERKARSRCRSIGRRRAGGRSRCACSRAAVRDPGRAEYPDRATERARAASPSFAARVGFHEYHARTYPLLTAPRRASESEIAGAAQSIADAMGDFLRRFPTQWFHFRERD